MSVCLRGPSSSFWVSQQHLGSAWAIIIINKRTENGNLQMRLEFLVVPRNQSKKGASARKMGSHYCKDIQSCPFAVLFPLESLNADKRERQQCCLYKILGDGLD